MVRRLTRGMYEDNPADLIPQDTRHRIPLDRLSLAAYLTKD